MPTVPEAARRLGRNPETVRRWIRSGRLRSVFHRAVSRGSVDLELGRNALDRLDNAPVGARSPRRLGYEAWRIADELGWAKTYDAEYVALAALLGCRLVTLDARLRRSADRLSLVVSPLEL